jgi:hypothetical protein
LLRNPGSPSGTPSSVFLPNDISPVIKSQPFQKIAIQTFDFRHQTPENSQCKIKVKAG